MHDQKTMSQDVRSAIASLHKLATNRDIPNLDSLRLYGTAPPFNTRHKLTVASASAIGAFALAVEDCWQQNTGRRQSVGLDWMQAACGLHPGHFQSQSGHLMPAMAMLTELKSDFLKTQDDRWFFPVGATPKLRDGILDFLGCPNNLPALAAAVSKWRAQDLEDSFAEKKFPGAYSRTSEEWRAHAQGKILNQRPAIEIVKIADSPVEAMRPGVRPLSAMRVLDLGHIIAGPVVARSLAEHGADVLRLSPPMRQDPFRYTIDTNIGKRCAFLDFASPSDLDKAKRLAVSADIVVQSWRPGAMQRVGLGPEDLADIRPGVVYVSVSAFGDEGPWSTRGGYEQLGQVVSGIAHQESREGKPALVPTYLLNDYLTGYLGATGAVLALARRAREGGSYHVKVSLARTSMWVQSLGLEASVDERARGKHFDAFLRPVLERRDSAYGVLEQLAPVAQFSETRAQWSLPPPPTGAHEASWLF